ncbi:MAG: DUF4065 domain-containing protein [Dehalococcoidales bacterium]|nr:DUF4065 domain-containing protein [Dehalococcoidales bacterium]
MTTKILKGLCSNCERETNIEVATKEQVINVRKEPIKVSVEVHRCTECGDEALDPRATTDPFDLAYREYRKKHGLLQPEEMKSWRKAHGLSQVETARLLHLGTATLNRYENGSLQDSSHDTLIRFAMDTQNLMKLVEQSREALSDERRKSLLESLKEQQNEYCTVESAILANVANYKPDEFSGYKKLDISKFYNAVLFFCKEGVVKTKLNKLLFYADFKHFKENSLSITGVRYAHLPYGPTPNDYELFYATMRSLGLIEFVETIYPHDIVGERLKSIKEPDLNAFDTRELKTLAAVKVDFEALTAKRITDFSHEEQGYQDTKNGELISYGYAVKLNH